MLPLTDYALAYLCQEIYNPSSPVQWDHFDDGTHSDSVCWGVFKWDTKIVVVFRGSTTFQDWVRDFDAFADPIVHDTLGPCHPGFLAGMEGVATQYRLMYPKTTFIVTGHSLGAARASIFTGLTLDLNPQARVVFGEPKPGFQQLADLIYKVPGRSYMNGSKTTWGHDLICDLPFTIPPENYVHPSTLIDVSADPLQNDEYGLFSYHHVELYVKALSGGN